MKKAVKIWLITAAVLVVLGIGLMTAALAAVDFDITRLGTIEYVTNTHKVTEKFTKIAVDESTSDIEFAPAEDKQCSVVCREPEGSNHTVAVKDGVLTIKSADDSGWTFGLTFESPKITVCLPEKEYKALTVESNTGNVILPEGITFDSVDIKCDTGSVECASSVKGTANIALTTGNIKLEGMIAGALDLTTVTGNIKLDSVKVEKDVQAITTTGNVKLTDTIAKGAFHIKTNTGNVKFDACNAASVYAAANTGNITGTLLSAKRFNAQSDTGKVNVPNTYAGGVCELITNTGNIEIELV